MPDVKEDIALSGAGTAKGAKLSTLGYQMRLNTSKSCKVNVLTATAGARPKPVWMARLDGAHGGVNVKSHVPHINVNPQVNTNLRFDPHYAIPGGEGGLKAGTQIAKVCKTANEVLLPVAVIVDAVAIGTSEYKDYKNRTSRNTVETAAGIAGGWAGGFAGAEGGALIGTAIFPGIGTLLGGIIGGIAGGVGGSLGASKLTEVIADDAEYDIVLAAKPCKKCGRRYKYRKYLRKDNGCCDRCQ